MDFLQKKINSVRSAFTNQDDEADAGKKTILLIAGAVAIIVVLLLLLLLTSGPGKSGQKEMKDAMTPFSEALAITTTYEKDLSHTPTKNDISLIKTLLRSNYGPLSDLYNDTFQPKPRLLANPKPDSASDKKLEAASRNNTLDDEILKILEPKIIAAANNLQKARKSFTKQSSIAVIETAQKDLRAILDILNKAR